MARITRKELKSDKFALEVGQTVSFFEEHRQEILRYGAIALGVAVLVELANDRFSVNEPDKIEAFWCGREEIAEALPRLESWSQLLWSQYLSRAP